MLQLILTSLVAGFVITVAVPWIRTQLDRIPGFTNLTGNRFIQMIVVGFIVLATLGFFMRFASKIKV